MNKHWIGYVLLPLGLVAVFGGFHHAADGTTPAWFAVPIGAALVGVAFRFMRTVS
jgi:hypothetical protein